MAVERAAASNQALLAAFQPLTSAERIVWQWIIVGAGTPPPLLAVSTRADLASFAAWQNDDSATDSDALRAARLKLREPLLHASGRLVVESGARPRVLSLFGRAWGPIRSLNVPGAGLVRSLWPSWLVRRQAVGLAVPLVWWPARLNSRELSGLLALPFGDGLLPGVALAVSRQLPPVAGTPTRGTVLADSTYPGSEQPLTIARRDRLMHAWAVGPTGVGKSSLLASISLSSAAQGDGMAVLDPKSDLVNDILARLPKSRWDDVIVIDAADTERPISVNILGGVNDEAGRELVVDQVLHVFKQQWADYWGPRTESTLRSALLSLTSTRAHDGSRFTLCEVPELLTNASFRRSVTSQPTVPASLRRFWQVFESLSEAERRQHVGPVMNKLSSFTTRTSLRLLLGQSQGLDLRAAIRERKIILIPLSGGVLGMESAGLIGSLLVASLWAAGLARTALPPEQRRPWWLVIDEAQQIVRLPQDISELLALGRGLGIGVLLANQHISQLSENVRHALLSTVRTQIAFALEPDDARVLARAFEPHMTERDLRSLPAYEVAMRICVNGQTQRPVTGKTRPLGEPTADPQLLRVKSRQRYGTARSKVEAALESRLQTDDRATGFGRRKRAEGEAS